MSRNHQEDAAVTVRSRSLLAAAVGVWCTLPLAGQEPARIGLEGGAALPAQVNPSSNQHIANTIADHLRQSGQLRHYRVDIAFQDGTAELSGTVADQSQREEAVRLVQGVPGVERVRDQLMVRAIVTQTQAVVPQPGQPVLPPGAQEGPFPRRDLEGLPPGALPPGAAPAGGMPMDPVPLSQVPPPSPYDATPPRMPPYAWPTYAPYNNYSRVAYPTLYPYSSWPFIGPIHPFPTLPPGWRSVKLEWQDGYWWYSTHSNRHDWWRLRYW